MLIAEELLVLACRPGNGKLLVDDTGLDHALTAALLAELATLGRITVVTGRIGVMDPAPTGDAELDLVLADLVEQPKRRTAAWWIAKRSSAALRTVLLNRLVSRGALAEQNHRVLGFLSATRHVEVDPAPRRSITDRIAAVLDGHDPDERIAVLVSLVRACQLDRELFSAEERTRIKEIASGDWAGDSARALTLAVRATRGLSLVDLIGIAGAGGG